MAAKTMFRRLSAAGLFFFGCRIAGSAAQEAGGAAPINLFHDENATVLEVAPATPEGADATGNATDAVPINLFNDENATVLANATGNATDVVPIELFGDENATSLDVDDATDLVPIEPSDDENATSLDVDEVVPIELFDDENATLLDVDEKTSPLVFGLVDVNWTNIEYAPSRQCESTAHFCLDVPAGPRATPDELLAAFQNEFPEVNDVWWERGIGQDILNNFPAYEGATKLGVAASHDSMQVTTFAIGAVVENIDDVDYLKNKFKVSMRVYVQKVELEEQPESLLQAFGDARSKQFSVVKFENRDDHSQPFFELLESPWTEVQNQTRYQKAEVVENAMCSMKYHKRMRDLTMDEYTALGSGLKIQHSTAKVWPVEDDNGNLLYLEVKGAEVMFKAPNQPMYPFQAPLLDINLYFPRGRQMDRILLCINPHYTGLLMPMEGIAMRKVDKNYLTLIPHIKTLMEPPFLGRSLRHMRNNYGEYANRLQNGNKVVHLASFRMLYVPLYTDGLHRVMPFIFIIITVYAQWFTSSDTSEVGVADMLASTLQLNTIISAQNNYLLYNNKLTRVIYLTYAIVLAKIITTALMASIKGNMLLGKYPWLVRHSNIIFRATRLAALLSSSFLVPILAVHTDNLTGQQYEYSYLYYVVGFGNLAVMLVWGLAEYRKYRKAQKKVRDEEMKFNEARGPAEDWSEEDVATWIGGSELLRRDGGLTEGELEAVASKFLEAKIKDAVFAEVAYDEEKLMKVGLTMGEAALFLQTMNKMNRDSSMTEKAVVPPVESSITPGSSPPDIETP